MQKPPPVYEARYVLHPEQDQRYVHFENAASHPFQPQPVAFPRVNVWWLVEAALLSYWDPDDGGPLFQAAGLDCEFLEVKSTECYLAWQHDWLMVAFRGTESDEWGDLLAVAKVAQTGWDVGRVHTGFADAIEDIWPKLSTRLGQLSPSRSVWFCGHSLGGALATLAGYRYRDTRGVCTLGCPRVGNPAFATALDRRLSGKSLRYVNRHDVVTHVPPSITGPWFYKHVAERRVIAPDGTVSQAPPVIPHFFTDLLGSPIVLLETINGLQNGSLTSMPRFLLDHMPKAYAIWAWNDYEAHG